MKNLKNLKKSAGQLLTFIAPYKWGFFGAVFMVLLMNITMVVIPTVEGMITTQLTKDTADILAGTAGAGVRFDIIARIALVLLVLYLTKMGVQVVGVFLLTNSIQNAMHDLRNAVHNKIHRLPIRYFDSNSYGDVLSRVTNDVDTVSNALQQTFTQMVSGILTLIFSITAMFLIQPVMAWVAALVIPLSAIIVFLVVRVSQKYFKAQQDSVGELNGVITEMYSGYNEILLYNRQEYAEKTFRDVNRRLRGHAFKAQFISSLVSPLLSLVTYLTIGTVAVIGCVFAITGMITIGQLQAFIRYIWYINDPLSQISQMSAQLQSAAAATSRVFEILRKEDEVKEADPGADTSSLTGNVSFEHVRFGYGEKPVIRDLNLSVKSGQMVAIVGHTGAGKTTLINLLMRFYDVNSGSIKIDGVDIRDMKRDDLRAMFGMVLQDTWLFSGTIFENLRYGRLDARRDEVIEAAKVANVHHFIRTLPEGYDMRINEEGNNISQGEKQLLTIARAILKRPRILILDEATSSVDTRLEKMLQTAMHKVMKGRTSFVIAHRLSTIKNADLILVMQNGEVVEQGTHKSLMEQKGEYEKLYNSQFAHLAQ